MHFNDRAVFLREVAPTPPGARPLPQPRPTQNISTDFAYLNDTRMGIDPTELDRDSDPRSDGAVNESDAAFAEPPDCPSRTDVDLEAVKRARIAPPS